MKTAKDEVRELLEGLPDDASLEDIQYHIYVQQKVQKGLDAVREGRILTHQEVVRRMSRWLEKSSLDGTRLGRSRGGCKR